MAVNSKIEWCDHSINFWTGCTKVSTGCARCYMYRDKERWKKDPKEVIKVKESTIKKVLKEAKPGEKIFTCSWSDFFIEDADPWRPWAWDIIRSRPDLHWQILTKRVDRIQKCLPTDWGSGWDNVWLGFSAETLNNLFDRITKFMIIPTKTSFISFEPLLEFIETSIFPITLKNKIDWVIIGGESGNKTGKYRYRECDLAYISEIIDTCKSLDIPVFVKQLGTHLAKQMNLKDRHGRDPNEWPEHIRIQQFPKIYTHETA